jgi:hypothetical protein
MTVAAIHNASPALTPVNTSAPRAQPSTPQTPQRAGESTIVDLSDTSRRLQGQEKLTQAGPISAADIHKAGEYTTPGSTYKGSNGSTIIVGDSKKLASTPLSVAWAPQLFVKGDQDGDNKLSLEEFSGLVKMAGVNSDDAKKLFDNFSKSDDGTLSVQDFVDGVRSSVNSGDKVFDHVFDSFLKTQEGKFDDTSYQAFMQQGGEAASQYWGPRGLS